MYKQRIYSLLVILLIFGACSNNTEIDENKFIQNEGIKLSYKLFFPRNRGENPIPAVVIGHGSGKVKKEDLYKKAKFWTKRGYGLWFLIRGVSVIPEGDIPAWEPITVNWSWNLHLIWLPELVF